MQPDPAGGRAVRAFPFLLLLSGFCGISYEVLYARILGNLVGDQFAVSASILLTFLLGIGVGTLYAHRLWRFLWLIEAGIGLCGVAFALGTGLLDALLYAAVPVLGGGLGASIFFCFLLLCVPAFLIGCSLPLFAGYLARLRPGRVFARAYTVYNFGAALTVLLIEFALLRMLGLRLAVIFIASLNGIVALALLTGLGRIREQRPDPAEAARYPVHHLAALALASVASAVFQLLMVKVAECLLGPFRETFALVLAIIFLGIAVGSTLTEKLRLSFASVVTAALGGLLFLVAGLPTVVETYTAYYATVASTYLPALTVYKLVMLSVLMGLPALAFGSTIPALLTAQRNVARESGQLLFVSSVANAGGFLLMALVLHRHLDYGVILLVVIGLGAAALVVYLGRPGIRSLAAVAVVLVSVGAHRGLWDEVLLYLGHTSFHRLTELEKARRKMVLPERFKGYQDVFSINWRDGDPWFFINGYLSIPLNSPSEKLVGAFASTFAPRTDRALVLGVGSGATAGAVGLLYDRTDAVEISPVVLENLFRMAEFNFDIEKMPGVRIIQDDGIHFVKTTDEAYSLIINTVTTPLYFSSSKLYTREFLESVRERLTPDGVYVTWFDTRVGGRGADIILKTLNEVFRDCWVGAVKEAYFLILCSQEPLRLRQPDVVERNETLRRYFYDDHGLAPEWIPYGLVTTRGRELIGDASVPLNTLDYPALEFHMARFVHHRGFDRFRKRLMDNVRLEDVAEAIGEAAPWEPLHLVLYAALLLGEESSITTHWRERVREGTPGFEERYEELRLGYHARRARVVDTAEAHYDHGSALLDSERYAEAIAEFSRALEIDPGRPRAHLKIGYALEMQGEWERALESYDRERARSPGQADVPYRKGMVLMRLERWDEAVAEFDAALALEDRASIHYHRGQALEGRKDFEAARRAYGEALRRNPRRQEIREALERLGATSG